MNNSGNIVQDIAPINPSELDGYNLAVYSHLECNHVDIDGIHMDNNGNFHIDICDDYEKVFDLIYKFFEDYDDIDIYRNSMSILIEVQEKIIILFFPERRNIITRIKFHLYDLFRKYD